MAAAKTTETKQSLTGMLSKPPTFKGFTVWLIGNTPLIVHAWSEKARREMLGKQLKSTRGGKEVRDPEADFLSSLYDMGDGAFGFPAMGIKNAILSVSHKDKGIARSSVMAALWIDADMVRVRPALAGAICDMPLIRIYGTEPEMREDMVKIGGIQKIANLAYRGQFTVWAMKVSGQFNTTVLTADALAFLIQEAGMACGLGEWRNERKGVFGSFHLADAAEEKAWDAYADGSKPLPVPASYQLAAE